MVLNISETMENDNKINPKNVPFFQNMNFNDSFLNDWVIGVYLPCPGSRTVDNPYIIFLRIIDTISLVMTEILPCFINGCENGDLMV